MALSRIQFISFFTSVDSIAQNLLLAVCLLKAVQTSQGSVHMDSWAQH